MGIDPLAQHRGIFAPVTALSFSAQQEQDCVAYITKRSANTELVPISDSAQLTMAVTGQLSESGYRFNILGFLSVCRGIAGGLSRLFFEIAGDSPTRIIDPDLCSVPAAVGIYNEALRVKFEALRERTLLVDNHARSIDGFLGLNHKLLDNQIFLELIAAEKNSQRPDAVFHRAELVGRELSVYILDPASHRTNIYSDPTHTFATGWYFCNREDAGNSVRAIPCLYTRFGVALMTDKRKQRLAHVGADLTGRASMLIGKTFNRSIDMDPLVPRVAEITGISLGFTTKKSVDETAKRWTAFLHSRGIPAEEGRLIVKNAITVGADIVPRSPLDIFTDKVLESRTVYDLVCSVLRFARKQPTMIKEKLQGVGYSLLFPEPKK